MPLPSPHLRLAHLLQHGRHEALEDAARQMLALASDDSLAWFFLGQSLLAQQKLATAEEAARKSITQDPESDRGFYLLTLVLLEKNLPREALAAALAAIRHDEGNSVNYAMAARALNQLSRYPEAAKTASTGLQANPRCDGCLFQLSQAKSFLGEHEEADAVTRALLAEDPEDAANHSARGYHLLSAGKPLEALGHFLEALRLEPNDADARSGLTQALTNRNFFCRYIQKFTLFCDRSGWKAVLGGLGLFLLLPKVFQPASQAFAWPAITSSLLLASAAAVFLLVICYRSLAFLLQLTHRHTRVALPQRERKAASWCLPPLLAAGWQAAHWIHQGTLTGALTLWPSGMLLWALLTCQIWETFDAEKARVRRRMAWICILSATLILFIHMPGSTGKTPVLLSTKAILILESTVILLCVFSKQIRQFLEKRDGGT